jgi:hypothetical protein
MSIDPFQKSILNFTVDPEQPLFGAFGPFLIRLPLGLELRNSCFGGVQLMRKLLRRVERMLVVGFGEVRRVVQNAQDRLSRSIELIAGGVFESRCEWYDSVRFRIGTIGLSTHRPPSPLFCVLPFVAFPDGLRREWSGYPPVPSIEILIEVVTCAQHKGSPMRPRRRPRWSPRCHFTAMSTALKSLRDAYRGAGRLEACYVVERLVDRAAREMRLDPVALRRRNFIPNDAYPYTTPVALTYDSGNYFKTLDMAMKAGTLPGLGLPR